MIGAVVERRLFVRDQADWEERIERYGWLTDEPASAVEHPNAILLPLQLVERSARYSDGVYRGGVCTSGFQFIAGRKRNVGKRANFDCDESYEVPAETIVDRDESVVFGGIIDDHFGHMLLDVSCRLWYLVQNPDFEKAVFLRYPNERPGGFDALVLLDLMGIPRSKVEVIDRPTRFKSIIVPDETSAVLAGIRREFAMPFERVRERIAPGSARKLYLTRTGFEKHDIVGERFFEEFYRRRGFQVVSPETLPIEEQVSLVAGADEIVTTLGTMSHLILFAKPTARVTIFVRWSCQPAQLLIDKAAGIEPNYVDAFSNPLPVRHNEGPFLMLPNQYFRDYLIEAGEAFEEDELNVGESLPQMVFEFLQKWGVAYSSKETINRLDVFSMFDVVDGVDRLFAENGMAPSSVQRQMIGDLNRSLGDLKAENRALKSQIEKMKNSKSWKATKPLRSVGQKLRGN